MEFKTIFIVDEELENHYLLSHILLPPAATAASISTTIKAIPINKP